MMLAPPAVPVRWLVSSFARRSDSQRELVAASVRLSPSTLDEGTFARAGERPSARGGRIGPVDRRDLGQRAMNEGPQQSLGEMRATISREMVRLQAEYYGKGPTRAKTYIVD